MSLSIKGAPTNSKKLSGTGKATALNPNAAEFIPSALRSSSGFYSPADVSTSVTSVDASGTGIGPLGKPVPDRSESSISNNFDEEAHLYWHHQLPDDITPDFKIMGEDESQAINSAPFSILSIHDTNEASRFSASAEKMRQNTSSYGEDASSANFPHSAAKAWGNPIGHNDQLLITVRDGEGPPYKRNSRQGLQYEHAIAEKTEMNPLEFLASQFPGFATESLAEVCFATGGDLNLTIEMLTQLELQVDGGLNQNLYSKALSAPNVDSLDFPALSTPDGQNSPPKFSGDDNQLTVSGHRSSIKDTMLLFKSNSSIPTRGAIDFASAVRKMSSQDSGIWKYERNASADAIVGSSTSAHVLASSYNGGRGKGINSDRLQNRSSSQPAPVWLETGEAVANLYSEMRDEARDHARLRNAYFDQARQAYLIGNKALAKELSVKGQLHNLHMKAAHGKAQESIYRQRNPVNPEMPRSGRGLEKIIDLHGLHASEATHVLKRELALLRGTARSAEQQLQVYICVGTGHHTRGSRTPARLPIAVQRYLLEEEGLDYSEPQPGLLRVVIF